MGKHRNEGTCPGEQGEGKVRECRDGQYVWVSCQVCRGRGTEL